MDERREEECRGRRHTPLNRSFLIPNALIFESRVDPRNAELCRRPGRPGHTPPALGQGPLDHLSLPGDEVVRERLNRVWRLREFPTQPALVDAERLRLTNDDGALDEIGRAHV